MWFEFVGSLLFPEMCSSEMCSSGFSKPEPAALANRIWPGVPTMLNFQLTTNITVPLYILTHNQDPSQSPKVPGETVNVLSFFPQAPSNLSLSVSWST